MAEAEQDQIPNVVVIVTYSDRAHLLYQATSAVLNSQGAEHITRLVAVDNAASSNTKSYLKQLAEREPRLAVISFWKTKVRLQGLKLAWNLLSKPCSG